MFNAMRLYSSIVNRVHNLGERRVFAPED